MATAAIGMFDGLHIGHRYLLDFLKSQNDTGDRPVVFTFSNHPLEIIRPESAPRRLSTAEEKAMMLTEEGTRPVMLEFDKELRSLTARQFLQKIHEEYGIDRLVLGFNNRFGSDRDMTFDDYHRLGQEIGVEVIAAPAYPDTEVSSSVIRKLLASGEIEDANRLLGRCYTLSGTVVSGKRLGRTIGFPTANVNPDDSGKLVPRTGVYAVDVTTDDGLVYRGMLNIGHRPTVDDHGDRSIEVYLDNFSGNLYGCRLTLTFLGRLRDERRFDSLEALREQLSADLEAARRYYSREMSR